jgi:hypothetical protein
VPGKVDWLAHNLDVEGDRVDAPTLGRVMRDDAVRCAPTDRVADVRESIRRSPYPFALVTTGGGAVLGRVPASAPGSQITLIVPGSPSTSRPITAPGILCARSGATATSNPPEVIASVTSRRCTSSTPGSNVENSSA